MNVTEVSPESRSSSPEDAGGMTERREPRDGTDSTGNRVADVPSPTYASGSTPLPALSLMGDAKCEGGDIIQGNDQCHPPAPGSMVEVDVVGERATADVTGPRITSAPNAQEPPYEGAVQEANQVMGHSVQTTQSDNPDNPDRGSILLSSGTSGVEESPIEEGRREEGYVKQDSEGHDRSAAPGADARGDSEVNPARSSSETASGSPVDGLDSSCSRAPNADSFSEVSRTRTQPVQEEAARASPHGDEIRVQPLSTASVDTAYPSTPVYGVGLLRDGPPNATDSETRALESSARSGVAAPGKPPVCGRDDARCTSLISSGERSSSSTESEQGNTTSGAPCDSHQFTRMGSTNDVESPLVTTMNASGSAKDAEESAETRSKTIRGVQCSEVASVSDAGDMDVNIAGTSDPEMGESAATPPVGAERLGPKDATRGVSFSTLPSLAMALNAPGRAEEVETATPSLPTTGETARTGNEGLVGAHWTPSNETSQAAVSQGSASASPAIRTMEIESVQGGIYSSTPLDQVVEGEAPHADDLMDGSLDVMGVSQVTPPEHVHGLAHQQGGTGEADNMALVAGTETRQVEKSALAGTESFCKGETVPVGILGGSLPSVMGGGASEAGTNRDECGMILPNDLDTMGAERTKEGSERETADMDCTLRDQEEGEGVVIDVESTGEPETANGEAKTPTSMDSSQSPLLLGIETMLGTDTSKDTTYEEFATYEGSASAALSPVSGPFARYPPALGAATARANAKKVADAMAELEAATDAAVAEVREAVAAVVSAMHADLKRNAALQRATAVRVAPSPAPPGSSSAPTVGSSAARSSSPTSASLVETVDGDRLPADARSRSITQAVARGLADKSKMRTTRSTRGNARKNDRHDDMMHAMCMICLEKLSDPTERGSAKVLGLLDSCSHRYCYPCILEWSKVTNKCPQCMSRFHTIRAVKELRRNNSNANSSRDCRYRGVAVTVEDRDQTCMDVHDVMVLDPGVRCRDGCLLRGAVDSLQRGWEFSVQCERCSVWFHGVCVGFHEERTVPDRWFCHACGGPPYPPPQRSASSTSGSSSNARGRGSTRGRVRGRGQTGSTSGGRYPPPAPIPRRGRGGGLLVGSGHVLAQPIDSGARTRGRITALGSSDGADKGTGGGAVAEGAGPTRESQAQSLNSAQESPSPSSAPQQSSPRLRLSLPSLPALPPPPTRSRRRLHLTLTSPDPEHSSSSAVQVRENAFSQATSSSLSTPPPRSPPSRPREGTSSPATPRLSPTAPPATSSPNGSSEDIPKPGTRPLALPKPPASSVLRELGAAEMTDLCDICGFDTEPDNLIVYCESCNMGVHQNCYGISTIPNKAWYCSPCAAGIHPSTLSCRFCPVKGGALKRCTDGRWGHILCAFWIPECCFIDPRKMEPIGSISLRGQTGGVEEFLPSFRFRMCHICGTMTGCSIRCYATGCRFHLHPMCGKKAGNVYMEIETPEARADGRDQGVHLVAKCPRHHKGKGCARKSRNSRRPRPSIGCGDDPLRVFGTIIEIPDPTEGNVVLRGKVTWYDPVRSRYCVVEEGTIDGGNGCAHWIAADKLEAMRAISIHPRYGKSLVTRRPPSAEPELLEGESSATATATATATGNASKVGAYIKLEPQDGEDAGEEEEDDGELVLAGEMEAKEHTKAVTSDGEKGPGDVDSDETESEGEGEGEEMRLMLDAGVGTGDSTPGIAGLGSTSQDGLDNRTAERYDSEPPTGEGSLGFGAGNSRDCDDAVIAQMEGIVKEETDVSPASESEEAPATKRMSSRLAIKAAMKVAQQVGPEERYDHQAPPAQAEKRKSSVEDDDRLDSEREVRTVQAPDQDNQAQDSQDVDDPGSIDREDDRAVEGSPEDPGHPLQKAADSSDPQPGDDCPRSNDEIPSDVDTRENASNPNEASSGGLATVTTATEADESATHVDAGDTKAGKLPAQSVPKEQTPNPPRTAKLRSDARATQHQHEQQHLRQRDRTSRYPLRATRRRSNGDQESNLEPVIVDTPSKKKARVDDRPVAKPLPDRNDSAASSSSLASSLSSGKRLRFEVDAHEVSAPAPGSTEPVVASSSSSKKPRLEVDSALATPNSAPELPGAAHVSSSSSSKEVQLLGDSSGLSGSTSKPMEPTDTNSTSSPDNKSRVEDESPDAPFSATEPMETGDAAPCSSSEKSSDASQKLPCNDAPPANEAPSDSGAAAASSQRETIVSGEETGASKRDGTPREVLGTEMVSAVPAPAVVNGERMVAAQSVLQEGSPAHRVELGWPALRLMGQVAVMQVRSINISEGRSARYFAGAFARRGVAGPKRFGPRISFNFDDLENVHGAGDNGSAEHPSASDLRDRGKSIIGCKRGRGDDEASTGTKSPRRSTSGPEDEKDMEENRPYGADTMPPSPPDTDMESLEDGEIETLPDGRADIMPPSPSDDGMGTFKDMILGGTGKGENDGEAPEGRVQGDPTSRKNLAGGSAKPGEDSTGSNSEDLEISGQQSSKESKAGESNEAEPESGRVEKAGIASQSEREAPGGSAPKDVCSETVNGQGCGGVDRAPSRIPPAHPGREGVEDREVNFLGGSLSVAVSRADTPVKRTDNIASVSADVVVYDPPWSQSTVSNGATPEQYSNAGKSVGGSQASPNYGSQKDPTNAMLEETSPGSVTVGNAEPVQPIRSQRDEVTLALRSIVREQIEDILLSSSQAGSSSDEHLTLPRIAEDIEKELFERLYRGGAGERAYKAKYKQLILSLGNVRNYRLVTSVIAGTTTPADLATKDAVGLLNSLNSNLNCLAIPLAGRLKHTSPRIQQGKGAKAEGRTNLRMR